MAQGEEDALVQQQQTLGRILYFDLLPMDLKQLLIKEGYLAKECWSIWLPLLKITTIPGKYVDESKQFELITYAAYYGYLSILKNLKADPKSLNFINTAASGGQLEVVKWCRENGSYWNDLTCTYAVK